MMYASTEPQPGTTARSRPRIGIYEPSGNRDGMWRYADIILSGIDIREFEVILFCRRKGMYGPYDGIRQVPLTEDAPESPGMAPPAASKRALRRWAAAAWRRLTPTVARRCAGFAKDARRLAAVFRPWRLDLLHTNNLGYEPAVVAARMARIPQVVSTFHIESNPTSFSDRSLQCLTNHCLDRAIAVSESTKAYWARRTYLSRTRIVTVPNGVDPEQFSAPSDAREARRKLGLPEGQLLVGGVGRLYRQKGFADLIEAVALLAKEYPNLSVVLAGDGPLRQELTNRAAALGVSDRLHLLGYCPEVRTVYRALDVFALPSLWEAMPYVLLEAMATGLPVVGSSVAGVPEVIVPGESGFLSPPKNPVALATALRPLLDSPDLRCRMGRTARQRVVRRFSLDTMRERTFNLYREHAAMALRLRKNGTPWMAPEQVGH